MVQNFHEGVQRILHPHKKFIYIPDRFWQINNKRFFCLLLQHCLYSYTFAPPQFIISHTNKYALIFQSFGMKLFKTDPMRNTYSGQVPLSKYEHIKDTIA